MGGWEVGGRDDDGDWMWPPRGDQSAALVHWCNIKPTAAGVGFGAPGRVDIQHPFSSPVYTSLCPSGGPHSIARESTTSPSNSQHLLLLPPSPLSLDPATAQLLFWYWWSCKRRESPTLRNSHLLKVFLPRHTLKLLFLSPLSVVAVRFDFLFFCCCCSVSWSLVYRQL